MSVTCVDRATDVGGTWYWNRYPGAQCDIPSASYQYTDEELLGKWTGFPERYSSSADIRRYLQFAADTWGIRPHIHLKTAVASAVYDEKKKSWSVKTECGKSVVCRFLIMATGCLSKRIWPNIEGIDSFTGRKLHTNDWPRDGAKFAGRRVGVIGTGSSAVQTIVQIAPTCKQLSVFQRTPTYVAPAQQRAFECPEKDVESYREWLREDRTSASGYAGSRSAETARNGSVLEHPPESRAALLEKGWQAGGFALLATFTDLLTSADANAVGAEFIRDKIRSTVRDQRTAEALCPQYPLGCKRMVIADGYYETYNLPNVELVNMSGRSLDRITPRGAVFGGKEYELDDLIVATGFDAMTGSLTAVDVRGKGGVSLRETWARDGPQTLYGLAVHGFPNLFTITGPQSPSVLTNMPASIEQHVGWVCSCISWLEQKGVRTIHAAKGAQDGWVQLTEDIASKTVFEFAGCNSWYRGLNVEGKKTVFMPFAGGLLMYGDLIQKESAGGYQSFELVPPPPQPASCWMPAAVAGVGLILAAFAARSRL
eukprot:TRINITY_DN4505_c0_g1_i1.p1 TRINITY_DN4505_c0_g1~~TRINITY_DN4505_c0_g1_i1.p1  ORF type:complete len:591 (+),score=154.01 TRINITY_DN4505_c0_g1_i1:156-1775(+)